ncbi:hypothetical protein EGW08_019867 [Elysia chlorotica]|uniref:Uncharacterized protein n=1 Tax=Elysia chlorotica TaxID=188477 RepID=A0A433ST93_ELYCH|nr:hypothetical protein EGW08_019867 [Elysia chlorotica]
MVSCMDFLGLSLLLIGVILTTVAIPTQEWTTSSAGKLGLWRSCPDQGSCTDLDDTDELDAVRAMMLMGDIVALLGVVAMLVAFVLETARDLTSKWTKLAVASAALLAGALILAGVIVYTTEIHDKIPDVSGKEKGYSFWLAIAALIIIFISAFVFIVSTFMEEQARLILARKTAELRETAREDRRPRKHDGRGDVVRAPEGALILAGVIVYTTEIHDKIPDVSGKEKGYSFWLAIAALIIIFISAFVFIVSTFMEEQARLMLARKTAELRETVREDRRSRKHDGRGDVVRAPEGHFINNINKQSGNQYQHGQQNGLQKSHQNGHLPNGGSPDKYRRRHRSESPGRDQHSSNIVWDRYQHKYVPRLVPETTVLPTSEFLDLRYGLPPGSYHQVDPVGPQGYISYVGNTRGHRRSPSDGYPGVHSFADWRRNERLLGQGYTPYSDPYLFY